MHTGKMGIAFTGSVEIDLGAIEAPVLSAPARDVVASAYLLDWETAVGAPLEV